MTDPTKTLIDNRYRTDAEVGQGGMAIVYRAYDERLARPVAIKMMRPQFAGDPTFLARFRREAVALANLLHPNLAAVWDSGETGGIPFIVMEYVDGDNLKTHIVAEAPMPADRVIALMIQVCEGVGAAHRAGLVHRDLKPQNILLTRGGQVKVTDFGIARSVAATAVSRTQTGQVWGTAQYIAPEQAAGQQISPATDVYSLGVIMFEMLTGRLPFEGDSPIALATQHLQAEPPPLRSVNPKVPRGLEMIVTRAMQKRPEARYPDADALCSALKAYQRLGEQITGPIPVAAAGAAVVQPTRPATASAPRATPTNAGPASAIPPVATPASGTDWATIGLGVAATLFLLGLLPLFWAVMQHFQSPAG
ncbi:MAG: protein kinase [Anaerolineae bacterium]